MRHLKWLVKLCFLWHIIKIIKSHGEMLSQESIFQLRKHPTVPRDNASHVIKNISKVCYDRNDTQDGDDKIVKATTASSSRSDNGDVKLLNIFQNILQPFQSSKCEISFQKKVEGEGPLKVKPFSQQRKVLSNQQDQFAEQRFNILQQLRLAEEQEKWQQQSLELQQQQQSALRLQHILQNTEHENLGKAGNRKKKKKKKKRKKRKKRKKPDKDKRKKRRKKKRQPAKKPTSLVAHPAQILFASPTQKPHHAYQPHNHDQAIKITTTTTSKPYLQHPLIPINKIKYLLRKNTVFKKKKKEYLNHLKHVLYPFVKFIAFFTILNPFTLAVFLFSLASPVVLGFIGFISLSFFIKPALSLLFGIKHTVNAIEHRKRQQLRKRQRLRDSRRPITIHKHYYQQRPIAPPLAPPTLHRYHPPASPPAPRQPLLFAFKPNGLVRHMNTIPIGNPHHHHQHPFHAQQLKLFNPLLPDVRQKLNKNKYFKPDIKGQNDSFEQF